MPTLLMKNRLKFSRVILKHLLYFEGKEVMKQQEVSENSKFKFVHPGAVQVF